MAGVLGQTMFGEVMVFITRGSDGNLEGHDGES